VLDASQGLDALRVAQEHSGTIHLLLSDLVMPRMTGRELADRLTRLRPGLKVLFMSGYAAGVAPNHEIPADAAYLEKPFTADALAGVVRALLDAPSSSGS
jgi:CheY-like chemotaxis protein